MKLGFRKGATGNLIFEKIVINVKKNLFICPILKRGAEY
jgi:hypothetical protein